MIALELHKGGFAYVVGAHITAIEVSRTAAPHPPGWDCEVHLTGGAVLLAYRGPDKDEARDVQKSVRRSWGESVS